ncbi:MAG: hypothetical protein RLZZ268_1406 [Cyanobacteriota bacterium]|jgi:hypothetical protein
MVFNRKASFFLDLGSEGAVPATVTIAEAKPVKADSKPVEAKPVAAAASTEPLPGSSTASPTTAEAIAAELRATQEALPPPSLATFAPDCLNPANALRSRRRLAGANLAGFKDMASGMFRN